MGNHKHKDNKKRYVILFSIYMAFLLYFLFFSDLFGRTVTYPDYRYNFKPFAEIIRYFNQVRHLSLSLFVINIFGNIIIFAPFGMLLPRIVTSWVTNKPIAFWGTTVNAAMFSLVVEFMQLVTKVGVFDVDDIILNTLGGMLGYGIYRLFRILDR